MFRNSLIAYDDINVRFVTAYANYHNGGYTWAKLAGRSISPDVERATLLERLPGVAKTHNYAERDIRALENLIKFAPDESLMYELACSASREGVALGKPLLVVHSWEAFWDLADETHRRQIAEALI